MSLTETSLWEVVKKQYAYKLKAHANLFFYLVPVQCLGMLSQTGSSGTYSNSINLTVSEFSSDATIIFTLIWAFVIAVFCTNKPYKDLNFAFVSTRLSSSISDIGFLLTAAIISGATASLSGVIIRVAKFLTFGSRHIAGKYFFIPPQDLLIGIIATILYVICSLHWAILLVL